MLGGGGCVACRPRPAACLLISGLLLSLFAQGHVQLRSACMFLCSSLLALLALLAPCTCLVLLYNGSQPLLTAAWPDEFLEIRARHSPVRSGSATSCFAIYQLTCTHHCAESLCRSAVRHITRCMRPRPHAPLSCRRHTSVSPDQLAGGCICHSAGQGSDRPQKDIGAGHHLPRDCFLRQPGHQAVLAAPEICAPEVPHSGPRAAAEPRRCCARCFRVALSVLFWVTDAGLIIGGVTGRPDAGDCGFA